VVRDPIGAPVPRDAAAAQALEQREGWLMWPERFGPKEIARIKAELGPYLASGRLPLRSSHRLQLLKTFFGFCDKFLSPVSARESFT
jgi:hypothetical protein